jgi:hypothetical protein
MNTEHKVPAAGAYDNRLLVQHLVPSGSIMFARDAGGNISYHSALGAKQPTRMMPLKLSEDGCNMFPGAGTGTYLKVLPGS